MNDTTQNTLQTDQNMNETMQNSTGNNSISSCNNILYDAAVEGNIHLLHELVNRDPFILYRSPSTTSGATPAVLSLHLACKLGHLRFVAELLHLRPDLSTAVDPSDQSSTALHLACGSGDLEMVKCLISINPNTCFTRDNQGMNPIHIAAERGYCEILNELIEVSPNAARVRVGGATGDTVMHLCVKHKKLDALKLLVKKVGDVMMLNAKDVDGNTMLHVAVIRKLLEITKFLLDDSRINKSVLNSDGLTPMDIHKSQQQMKEQHVNVDFIDKELESELKRAHALTAAEVVDNNQKSKYFGEWIEKERSTLMIVASLIAAIAFQGCLNPPGGVWQDNKGVTYYGTITASPAPSLGDDFHVAGTAIAAYGSLSFYFFIIFNSIGLFSSMIGLFLLISGLPWKKTAAKIVMVLMWIALASMTVTYLFAMAVLTMIPRKVENEQDPNIYTIKYESFTSSFGNQAILGIVGCFFMILFLHFTLGMMKLARKLRSGRGH